MSSETLIADLSQHRRRLHLTGSDRVTFLHGQCTNDIQRLRPTQSCYAAFLNAKGKMRGEGHVICLPHAFLLEVSEGLQASLEKFIVTEDVTIDDVSATLHQYLAMGATELLPDTITFEHPLGYGFICAAEIPVTLDDGTLETFRVEAGVPKWGLDMDESTIPNEAGVETRAINYDKGCYIGQETIARIKTYGHVNRHLVQLAVEPQTGTPVLPVTGRGEKIVVLGKEVGHVTSAVYSNRLGKTLALGYVRREFAAAGTKLTVGQQPAEVLKICGQ